MIPKDVENVHGKLYSRSQRIDSAVDFNVTLYTCPIGTRMSDANRRVINILSFRNAG